MGSLSNHFNDHHIRAYHNQSKKTNHQANFGKTKVRPVSKLSTIPGKYEGQIKVITTSKLEYCQTGANGNQRAGRSHFMITGRTKCNLDNKEAFSFEHLDGPVVQKEDGIFENVNGDKYAFIPNDSENEEMSYAGSGSDNEMSVEPIKKSSRKVVEELQNIIKIKNLQIENLQLKNILYEVFILITEALSILKRLEKRLVPSSESIFCSTERMLQNFQKKK